MTGWAHWRQEPADRMHQDAFLADIAQHWQPRTGSERALAAWASVVHLGARLFDGAPSMAPASIAGALAAVGTVLLPLAAMPTNPEYTLGPPVWAYVLITVGLIGLAIETVRSPRVIRPLPYFLLVALPLGLGTGSVGLLLHVATPADRVLQIGVPALGLGVALVAVCQALHQFALQRVVLRVTAVACAVTAAGQFDWAWKFGDSGYVLLAIASACTAAGAGVNAIGFARVRLGPLAKVAAMPTVASPGLPRH